MSATEQTLKRQVFEAIRQDLADEGFKSIVAKGIFTRRNAGIAHVFQLVTHTFRPGWAIHPEVGIRIDVIEDIFHEVSGTPPEYQKNSITVGNAVGSILLGDRRKYEFDLIEEAHLAPAIQGMREAFHEFAVPFFKKNGSIEAIDALLNADPGARRGVLGPGAYGIMRAVIVAKLLNRSDYDSLASVYSKQIEPISGGFYVGKFQTLLSLLESTAPLSNSN